MSVKVFVVGRPGSGKTTAANLILAHVSSEGYGVRRFKDYEILYQMYENDIKRIYQNSSERKFRSAEYGGFDVLDNRMFDIALKQLEIDVETALLSTTDEVITIEFARDDYRDALRRFSPNFLQDAYLLFVDCKLDTCVYRIYSRMSNPPVPDFHFVSEHIMHSYYNRENWDYMTQRCEKEFPVLTKVVAIENTRTTLEEFEKIIKRFAETIVAEVSHRKHSETQLVAAS